MCSPHVETNYHQIRIQTAAGAGARTVTNIRVPHSSCPGDWTGGDGNTCLASQLCSPGTSGAGRRKISRKLHYSGHGDRRRVVVVWREWINKAMRWCGTGGSSGGTNDNLGHPIIHRSPAARQPSLGGRRWRGGQVTSISYQPTTPSLLHCLYSLFDSLVKLQIGRKLKFILHWLFLL